MRITRTVVVLAGLLGAACAPALKTASMTPNEPRPRLTALAPNVVQLLAGNVTEVDLRGSGFDTSRTAPANTVRIGALLLRAVPSSARGTVIRVAIPFEVPGTGEAPPAQWMPGTYPVTVTTKAGTSDTLRLAIALPGGRP